MPFPNILSCNFAVPALFSTVSLFLTKYSKHHTKNYTFDNCSVSGCTMSSFTGLDFFEEKRSELLIFFATLGSLERVLLVSAWSYMLGKSIVLIVATIALKFISQGGHVLLYMPLLFKTYIMNPTSVISLLYNSAFLGPPDLVCSIMSIREDEYSLFYFW